MGDLGQGHRDFPIQNLPLGIFTPPGGTERRAGVAIGDMIFDLGRGIGADLFAGDARDAAEAASSGCAERALRARSGAPSGTPGSAFQKSWMPTAASAAESRNCTPVFCTRAASCVLHLPARIGDYTDFYVGIHHATNVGKVFRPDNPLLPNYKHVPIGYHGRASSVVTSGTPVRRPRGQLKPPEASDPSFGPSQRLDYELELGVWIGQGNALGDPIPIGEAGQHVAGFCLLNDWSARDIQAWEYQPLGPFLSKNFGTTVSPWVVTPEALAPFRIPQPRRAEGDPKPLPYLFDEADQREGAFDIELEVLLVTPGLEEKAKAPHRLALSSTRHMYWTVSQLVTHHTCNGCNLQPGDLLGSGTLSAPDEQGFGSLLETTRGGSQPIKLESGEERRFLQDGDEIILRARAGREGFAPVGFGDCSGAVSAASS